MRCIFDVRSSCPIPLRIDFFLWLSEVSLIKYFAQTHFVVAALDHMPHVRRASLPSVLFNMCPRAHSLPLLRFARPGSIDAPKHTANVPNTCNKYTRLRLHWKLFMRHAYFSSEFRVFSFSRRFLIDSGMCAVCTRCTLCRYNCACDMCSVLCDSRLTLSQRNRDGCESNKEWIKKIASHTVNNMCVCVSTRRN